MKSIVKIVYPGKKLKVATENSYEFLDLLGSDPDLEVKDQRRCVGFHSARGEMTSCQEFRQIESGDQCSECRRKDIYTCWRMGSSSPGFEADYSVYLALCGSAIKVGVTRSSRLQNRWREQGADYAAEIYTGLDGEEALEREKEISGEVSERVRKEKKLEEAETRRLSSKLDQLGLEARIEPVHSNSLKAETFVRNGPMPTPISNIVGQIVSNGKLAMALTSGKILVQREQKFIEDF